MKKLFFVIFIMCAIVALNSQTVWAQSSSIKIGEKGPGGGTVFYIAGNTAWEVSRKLKTACWKDAKLLSEEYYGGGYNDWYLPGKEELNWVYQNLKELGRLPNHDWYWSSSPDSEENAWAQYFTSGAILSVDKNMFYSVCVVRTFGISSR